jgi:site-specific DNA-cytosine methylase
MDAIAFEMFFRHVSVKHNVEVKLIHEFMCENCQFKQGFLNHVHRPRLLFADVSALEHGEGIPVGSEDAVKVPGCDIFTTGFSCKSASTMNKDRSSFGEAVSLGHGTTGQTLSGSWLQLASFMPNVCFEFAPRLPAVKYIERELPLCIILENVKAFSFKFKNDKEKDKDKEQVMGKKTNKDEKSQNFQLLLQRLGVNYNMVPVCLSPRDCGMPQSRARWFFIGVRKAPTDHGADVGFQENFLAALVTQRPIKMIPLEAFLLPPTCCATQLHLPSLLREPGSRKLISRRKKKAQAKGTKKPNLKQKPLPREPKWISRQKALFQSHGWTWPPFVNDQARSMLTDREEGVLQLSLGRVQQKIDIHASDKEICLEMSQSESRSPWMVGMTPCILPGQRIWLLSRRRLLLGVETMILQGFPFHRLMDAIKSLNMSNRCLNDLGGNAFNGGVFVSILAALFHVVDFSQLLD